MIQIIKCVGPERNDCPSREQRQQSLDKWTLEVRTQMRCLLKVITKLLLHHFGKLGPSNKTNISELEKRMNTENELLTFHDKIM